MLHEKLKNKRVILASQSPRRRELIAGLGIDFELAADYEVEEKYPESLPACEVAEYLSELKSSAYPHKLSHNEILITADTVVIFANQVLGKPSDRDDAMRMIEALSGNQHTVTTGVTLRSCDRKTTFSARTEVWFRELTTTEIEYYVDTYRPFDKAGAYGIQEWIGFAAIECIEGSYFNVMGLPTQMLYVSLGRFL